MMPHAMFDAVAADPPSARSRRTSLLVLSLVAHTLIAAVLLVASVVASGTLPSPRRALTFVDPSQFVRVDIELPSPPPARRNTVAPASVATAPSDAAPVEAPHGIAPESRFEAVPSVVDGAGAAAIERGSGVVEGVGLVELPPPPPAAAGPVRLHSGIRAPKKTVVVAPVYPPAARIARVEGLVILEAVIDAGGRVESARVLRSQPLLDEAALAAVRRWQFTPAELNGVAVPVVMTVTVDFVLQER
jgi:periplasmic protein TonB